MARERTFRQITEQSRNLLRRIDNELREARANRDFQRFRTLTTRRRRVVETTERYRGNTTRLRGEAENTKIDKSVNFYEDTPENQVARHREVQKIKDRINAKADINNDAGLCLM